MNTERKLAQSLGVDFKLENIKIGDYFINYIVAGEGEPVLLIHGGNIGWGQWYLNIPELSRHFKVYALDLPGAGRSTRIDYSKLNLDRDFVDVVDQFIKLKNLNDVNIVGSSIGGWIALKLALKDNPRINRLVLVDSLGFTDYVSFSNRIIGIYPVAKIISKTILRPHRENKNVEKFLRSVLHDPDLPLKKEFIDYFYETMETSHNILFFSCLSSIFGINKELILRNELPRIRNNTLIVWGKNDKLLPLEKNRDSFKLIQYAQVGIIENSHHMPFIEKYAEFNKLIIDFLKS